MATSAPVTPPVDTDAISLQRDRSMSILDACIDVSSPPTPRPKAQAKISEKLQNALQNKNPYYSFEYFPPKTKQGLINLTERIQRMGWSQPLWVDITHSKTSKTLELARLLLDHSTVDIMVHLSMTDMTKKDLLDFCDECKSIGIRNLLAIRGDPPRGYDTWIPSSDDLNYCSDLVSLIRTEYGNYFSIFVGGYPEGHHSSPDIDTDIKYLKKKIDAGADGIITQLFYDPSKFLLYVEKCRKYGINVPIIPGLMPIQTYATFVRIVSFSNVSVPSSVWTELDPIKDNDEKVKEYGINYTVKMCKEILKSGINILHFYTFNLERSVTITLEKLQLYVTSNTSHSLLNVYNPDADFKSDNNVNNNNNNRVFPWERCKGYQRGQQESVRPIFWSNRSESYLHRTSHWDEYPNGRWGDSRSPAYGEFIEHHLFRENKLTFNVRQSMWGNQNDINTISDISNVFIKYLNTEINRLPWCDQSIGQETLSYLLEPLKILNRHNFLTINSQPQVNGALSTDPVVGWGRCNGYVYQKAYLEFFCSPTNLEKLLNIIDNEPTSKYNSLSYHAINVASKYISNDDNVNTVNAVTWGVFPNCEILQPTIVDSMSFIAWKDEAFLLWKEVWQVIYNANSVAHQIIDNIRNNWFLVNIVENNYVSGNIFEPFIDLLSNDKNSKSIKNILTPPQYKQQNVFNKKKRQIKILSPAFNNKKKLKPNNNNNDFIKNPYLDQSLLLKDPIEQNK